MSLFKKPNKNIRRREVEVDEDDDSKEVETIGVLKSKQRNGTQVKSTPIKQALLSFGEEWNEGDDGEVFKVKKSSQSRKIRKQTKEEKVRKNVKPVVKETETTVITDDLVTIKIKNPISGPTIPTSNILSGVSAEMANYRSDSEEEEDSVPHHKFNQPDHVKMLLQSGRIPDATMIHAARKRRQQAREMGITFPEYNNFNDGNIPSNNEKVNESRSRLVREDDNEISDDEERITMSGIVSYSVDREKNKEGLDTCITSDTEDDRGVDEEWETQQIRKAVSEAQLAAVQQESYYIQYMNNTIAADCSAQQMFSNVAPMDRNSISNLLPVTAPINDIDTFAQPQFTFEPSVDSTSSTLNAGQISQKLHHRLDKLTEIYNKRDVERKVLTEQLETLHSDYQKRQVIVPELTDRFQFYQDLRGFLTDIIECLDEKIPLINSLEQRLISMYQKRALELISRRRQDVKDQVEELTPSPKGVIKRCDNERVRRAAEREGRRIRRSKKRNVLTTYIEGMSSDDEITEMASTSYRTQKEVIEADANRVFEDVVDEFTNVDSILRHFSEWRKLDKTAYVEAYASTCLPKVLGPIVRMNMMMWNPLNKDESVLLENMDWVRSLMMYAAEKDETIDSLSTDPDLCLVPKIIEKFVIPKLEQIIKARWDPVSGTETKRLTSLICSLLEYPNIGSNSKPFTQLINIIIEKMKNCVENDIFIPMFSKQATESGNTQFNLFFQRQFAMTVKLFSNILSWYGIINDKMLIEIGLTSILNRYLLMAVRMLQPTDALPKCLLIAQSLPSKWIQNAENCPTELLTFLNLVKQLILKIDINRVPFMHETINKLFHITTNL